MAGDESVSDSERKDWWVVKPETKLGEIIDRQLVRANSESEALKKISHWSVYEVQLRHENGGTEWEEVFAASEELSREEAYERDLRYSETLHIEESDLSYTVQTEREDNSRSDGAEGRKVRVDVEMSVPGELADESDEDIEEVVESELLGLISADCEVNARCVHTGTDQEASDDGD